MQFTLYHVDVQGRTINQGLISERFENIIKGPLPKRIVLGMVESQAYNGALDKNPFNFQHFYLKELSVSIDGEQIPYQPFNFDYTDKKKQDF